MNTGTKVTIGAGTIILIIGILATIMGVSGVAGMDDWAPTDDIYLEASGDESVSFIHIEKGNGTEVAVFVTSDVRCDEFTLEIQRVGPLGDDAYWKADACVDKDGRSLPSGYADDPEGWLHLGDIVLLEDGVEYSITTNHDVVLVGWDVIDGLIGGFLGALAGICGGPIFLCCGFFLLILGGLLAVTSSGPKKTKAVIEIENVDAGDVSAYQK